eukprot:865391-Pyramimonas_sp.AAC.1
MRGSHCRRGSLAARRAACQLPGRKGVPQKQVYPHAASRKTARMLRATCLHAPRAQPISLILLSEIRSPRKFRPSLDISDGCTRRSEETGRNMK